MAEIPVFRNTKLFQYSITIRQYNGKKYTQEGNELVKLFLLAGEKYPPLNHLAILSSYVVLCLYITQTQLQVRQEQQGSLPFKISASSDYISSILQQEIRNYYLNQVMVGFHLFFVAQSHMIRIIENGYAKIRNHKTHTTFPGRFIMLLLRCCWSEIRWNCGVCSKLRHEYICL